MSVIAWDGKTIAADRRGTQGNMMVTTSKIRRISNGLVIGAVGLYEDAFRLMEWFENGGDPAHYPDLHQDIQSILVVASKAEVFYFGQTATRLPIMDEFMAWGSGDQFAIGAMAMGATAIEAVEVASRFDAYCGNGVEAFDL